MSQQETDTREMRVVESHVVQVELYRTGNGEIRFQVTTDPDTRAATRAAREAGADDSPLGLARRGEPFTRVAAHLLALTLCEHLAHEALERTEMRFHRAGRWPLDEGEAGPRLTADRDASAAVH